VGEGAMTFDHMENNYCFVTGKFIPVGQPCRFTFEFDAWVSEEGQRKVYASSSDADGDLYLIRKEWEEQDEVERKIRSNKALDELSKLDEELGL
jgi:hypothetical protein